MEDEDLHKVFSRNGFDVNSWQTVVNAEGYKKPKLIKPNAISIPKKNSKMKAIKDFVSKLSINNAGKNLKKFWNSGTKAKVGIVGAVYVFAAAIAVTCGREELCLAGEGIREDEDVASILQAAKDFCDFDLLSTQKQIEMYVYALNDAPL